jgi:ACS family hexuronate transporter-like MFS transporter
VANGLSGPFIDSVGTRVGYACCMLWWSVAAMLFMGLSGWLIGRFGYTPVFIGYGIMPLIALAIVLFLIGPLRPAGRNEYESANTQGI